MATRLHYALSSIEDSILQTLKNALNERMPQTTINTYMFDGAVLAIRDSDKDVLGIVLSNVGRLRGVSFKVAYF